MPIVVIFIFGCPFLWLVVVKPPLLWHFDAVLGSGRPFHYVGHRKRSCHCVINYELPHLPHLEVSVSTNLEVLEAEVLQLPPVERSHLLERLIASLDSDPEVEEAWEREANRREAELESGSISAVSGHEAIARLRARLTR